MMDKFPDDLSVAACSLRYAADQFDVAANDKKRGEPISHKLQKYLHEYGLPALRPLWFAGPFKKLLSMLSKVERKK